MYSNHDFHILWFLEKGGTSDWIGDRFCDDINNIESCQFDDGDCCGVSVANQYCIECKCKCKAEDESLNKFENILKLIIMHSLIGLLT